MAKGKKKETGMEGLYLIEAKVFGDERGFFMEAYNKRDFAEWGLTKDFVQDNHSRSKRGVLRGLHFQTKHAQAKLLRVLRGAILDVVVDLRKESKTFGQHYCLELSEENKKMLYIPEGFAHGFLTLEEDTEILYKCTDFYYPEYEAGILWKDETLHINWNLESYGLKEEDLTLSMKDEQHPSFQNYLESLKKEA